MGSAREHLRGQAALSEDQIASLTFGAPEDDCWDDADRALIRLCDSLHTAAQSTTIYGRSCAHYSDEAILELLMLAGTYRTVSYLVNSLRLPLEHGARTFPRVGT